MWQKAPESRWNNLGLGFNGLGFRVLRFIGLKGLRVEGSGLRLRMHAEFVGLGLTACRGVHLTPLSVSKSYELKPRLDKTPTKTCPNRVHVTLSPKP